MQEGPRVHDSSDRTTTAMALELKEESRSRVSARSGGSM
jgi:hypothetical protein